ncbi:MAG: methyltransferase domain-containing protein [Candidatus Omnitrophica bacterium]|nr:methyltransferase domain-containing protein [Candidatus Omnitrophota bacterium]MDD5545964.1 methyltransferase domain-containing protein [Candidatus Omnitrophota bacterium]
MLNEELRDKLACPGCLGDLSFGEGDFTCNKCHRKYPVVDGIPVLINEDKSLFRIKDFLGRSSTTIELSGFNKGFLRKIWSRVTPELTLNIYSKRNFKKFIKEACNSAARPAILVIGGGVLGSGLAEIAKNDKIMLIESDVSFGPRTQIICDAHNLPFADSSLDGIIAQAVLEHVTDPHRCVSEIYRILRPKGLVYSEVPFMQQVHMGRYDFTRFTDLGHRRLFRNFEEIKRGVAGGPASALAWSLRYFFMSFTDSPFIKKILSTLSIFAFFWIKYLDFYLVKKASSGDAAGGFYFLGRKSDKTVTDAEIISLYKAKGK